jgi:hypothetical protein
MTILARGTCVEIPIAAPLVRFTIACAGDWCVSALRPCYLISDICSSCVGMTENVRFWLWAGAEALILPLSSNVFTRRLAVA